MNRGDIFICQPVGSYGKPRPALIVQSDSMIAARDSVTVCLLTSEIIDAPLFRINVSPDPKNGLEKLSAVMTDKLLTLPKEKLDRKIGKLSDELMKKVDMALIAWLGLGV